MGAYWGENFTIDAWGNLTTETGISGKTNSEGLNVSVGTNNRFTTASGVTYDAAGNLSSQQSGPNYRYDAENRLVYTSAGGYNYYYDGDGNRKPGKPGDRRDVHRFFRKLRHRDEAGLSAIR